MIMNESVAKNGELEALTDQTAKEYITRHVYVDGFFDGLIKAAETGEQSEYINLILNAMRTDGRKIADDSLFAKMALCYCVGVDKGLQLAEEISRSDTRKGVKKNE